MIEPQGVGGFLTVGQPTARRIARQAVERGRAGRTLLVHGPSGSGKDRFVDDLLALFLCSDPDLASRPCNACRGCRDARSRAHPDLVVGSPEAWRDQKSSGESIVAAARRWLLESAGAPVVADRRVVVIEHADRASEQIQNALLKVLEEPSDRHVFILVADQPAGLLPTIRSRCQALRIGPVARDELTAYLMDVVRLPADQADALARLSNGMLGTATLFAEENGVLLPWRRRVQAELLALLERGRADRFGAVRDLIDETVRLVPSAGPVVEPDDDAPRTPASTQRAAAILLVEAWLALTRDLMVAAAGRAELAPSRELAAPELGSIAARVGTAPLARMARLLERIHGGLRENAAPRLALEAAMLSWPMLAPSRDR
ncbi:MAG: ATP-binding protein [Candidatus Limnocylindria bacterium]